jgi:hypothetical protein
MIKASKDYTKKKFLVMRYVLHLADSSHKRIPLFSFLITVIYLCKANLSTYQNDNAITKSVSPYLTACIL